MSGHISAEEAAELFWNERLEQMKEQEDAWFAMHGFPGYSTVDEHGKAHPAHKAWVESIMLEPDRKAFHSPMSRKMFVLGWLKGRAKEAK